MSVSEPSVVTYVTEVQAVRHVGSSGYQTAGLRSRAQGHPNGMACALVLKSQYVQGHTRTGINGIVHTCCLRTGESKP